MKTPGRMRLRVMMERKPSTALSHEAEVVVKWKPQRGAYLLFSFEDGGEARIVFEDTQNVSGFGVNRPPASPAFWKVVIEILKATDSVLHWPGIGCAITNPAVRDDLPKEMLAAVGEPTVTEDYTVALDCIERG